MYELKAGESVRCGKSDDCFGEDKPDSQGSLGPMIETSWAGQGAGRVFTTDVRGQNESSRTGVLEYDSEEVPISGTSSSHQTSVAVPSRTSSRTPTRFSRACGTTNSDFSDVYIGVLGEEITYYPLC